MTYDANPAAYDQKLPRLASWSIPDATVTSPYAAQQVESSEPTFA
jgi:hypothetical protein